jgi:hypothetical protein
MVPQHKQQFSSILQRQGLCLIIKLLHSHAPTPQLWHQVSSQLLSPTVCFAWEQS